MPTPQEIENFIRQHAGVPMQQGAQQMGQSVENGADAAMAMKQAALQQLAGSGAPQQLPPQPPQQPMPPPEVQPNAASMSPQDAQNRMGAMVQAPATMEQVAAKLRAQADQDAAAEAHANSLQDQEMSGYQDVPSRVQREAAANQPAPRQFAQLKQKIQSKPQDVRDSMHGMQEVTPELEKKLGYGKDEDEE